MPYEYKYVEFDIAELTAVWDIEDYLNDFGKENWELCSCTEGDMYKFPRLIFKRKIESNKNLRAMQLGKEIEKETLDGEPTETDSD